MFIFSLLSLTACDPDQPVAYDTAPVAYVEEVVYGAAPWDPIALDWSDGPMDQAGAPVVLDANDDEVPLEAERWLRWDYDQSDWGYSVYAWRPVEPLAAGEYEIAYVGAMSVGETFEVAPYGTDPDFAPDQVAGRLYRVDGSPLTPPGLSLLGVDLFLGYAELLVEIGEVEDGAAALRLIHQDGDQRCVLLSDAAALSETGELTWSRDAIDAQTEQGEIALSDLSLRVGFSADGRAAAGGEFTLSGDTRLLSETLYPEDGPDAICELVQGFGERCHPCDDDVSACYSAAAHHLELTALEAELDPDLPMCGVDLSEAGEIAPLSCDIDLDLDLDFGCATVGRQAGFPLGALLLAILVRRRRPE